MKGCRSVSTVNEDAHSAVAAAAPLSSSASTPSAASGSRFSLQEGRAAQWSGASASERKRASSLESWLHNTIGGKRDVAEKEQRRAARRAKRKAFFRKMFFLPPSPEEDEAESAVAAAQSPVRTPPPSSKAQFPPRDDDDVAAEESTAYKLDQGYYASMASILKQYKSDCLSENGEEEDDDESETEKEDCFDTSDLDSNTDMSEVSDMSEISVFDLEEGDETDDETDELENDDVVHADYSLVPIPETELVESTTPPSALAPVAVVAVQDVVREMPPHVTPPVRVPMEYTLHDRRGGTLVGGKHVLFTSAAFKRKQRQMLYGMRSIDEDAQFVVPQIRDDDDESEDELNVSGVYALQNEWI